MATAKIDLRDRCARQCCNKLIGKGKQAQANFKRYAPHCSYHCQQWDYIESARLHIAAIKQREDGV